MIIFSQLENGVLEPARFSTPILTPTNCKQIPLLTNGDLTDAKRGHSVRAFSFLKRFIMHVLELRWVCERSRSRISIRTTLKGGI